jgi:hypothetical protein
MPDVRSVVGRYELLRELGRGGMATVYLARQVELDRLVALKELNAFRTSDPAFAQRFLREARLAGSLSHPSIVTVHDYFEHRGTPFIAMEYLEGGSLRPYVGRMTLPQLGGVLESVLAGLAHAARHDVVHRDLKPENVLATGDGRVKIADFGIAKATNALQGGAGLTSTGVAVGTPNYMAPEQALAKGIGPWTDLYAVGVMAFEFFVGLTPFGDTPEPVGVLLRQVNETIPPVRELDPRVDPVLSDWIGRMISKEAAGRPPSASAAWDELEERLTALLGPYWRRDARLPVQPDAFAPQQAFAEIETEPLDGRSRASTVAPRLPQEPTAPAPAGRRRAGGALALAAAVAALIAAAAAVVGRVGGAAQLGVAGVTTVPTRQVARQVTAPATPPTSVRRRPAVPTTPARTPARPRHTAPKAATGPDRTELTARASSARALANRYAKAASQIGRLDGARVPGSATARLAAALRSTAVAYRDAAAAATADDLTGYASATARAEEGKKTVDAALADVGSNGSGRGTSPDAPQPSSACQGDSGSDDPSDDSCDP